MIFPLFPDEGEVAAEHAPASGIGRMVVELSALAAKRRCSEQPLAGSKPSAHRVRGILPLPVATQEFDVKDALGRVPRLIRQADPVPGGARAVPAV